MNKILTPLGQLLTILTGLVAVVATILAVSNTLTGQLHVIDKRLLVIELGLRDRWRGQDMIVWAYRLGRGNPDLVVPDPAEIISSRPGDGGQ